MKLIIKNMVCNRCKMAVKAELEMLGLHPLLVDLGEVEIEEQLSDEEMVSVHKSLQQYGFALIDNKKTQLVEKVKNSIVELVHYSDEEIKINFSKYISLKLHYDYSYLSSLFTESENISIEKYFIAQKIERAKELIMYDEFSLSEIAFKLYYRSVSHLSKQFKKVTGFTPTHFKRLKQNVRQGIENL